MRLESDPAFSAFTRHYEYAKDFSDAQFAPDGQSGLMDIPPTSVDDGRSSPNLETGYNIDVDSEFHVHGVHRTPLPACMHAKELCSP